MNKSEEHFSPLEHGKSILYFNMICKSVCNEVIKKRAGK
jgi:hypothetical protein